MSDEPTVQSASLSYRTATRGPRLPTSHVLYKNDWVWVDDKLIAVEREMTVWDLLSDTGGEMCEDFYLDGAPPR